MCGSNDYIDAILKERQAELERVYSSIEAMENDLEMADRGKVKTVCMCVRFILM